MTTTRWWGPAGVPVVSWWTDRIVGVLLAVDLVVVLGPLCGLWATDEAVGLVLGLPALLGIAAALRYSVLQGDMVPGRRFGRMPEESRRLTLILLAGGPVPPTERAAAGRVAWWRLCSHVHTTWSTVGSLAGATSLMTVDRAGHEHWSAWGVVQVVILVGLLAVHPRVVREGDRWRRIARDPALVTPPL